jgi:hypothetical protein
MKKNLFLHLLSILLLISTVSFAQTITSTTAGGSWNSGSTWVGGFVPTAVNDVVIDGKVIVENNICKNLTINSGGTLQAGSPGYCCYEYVLTVTGNVINNGTTQNNPDGNWLAMKVSGNITNNGSWRHTRTDLVGSPDQYLTSAQNKVFESSFKVTDLLGAIVSNSALIFSKDVDLNGCVLDMKNYALTLNGVSATVFNGRVINTGDLVGREKPTLYNITYEGNPNIKGLFLVRDAVIKGTLTIVDTLRSWSPGYCCYEYVLAVTGNVINNGTTQNNPDGNRLAMKVSGNITNNGSWKHTRTDLVGSADQYLTSSPSKVFESSFSVTDILGRLIAGSALAFNQGFDLNGSVLDMKNYSLTLIGTSATLFKGRVINVADLIGLGAPTFNNITYEGNPNLKGLIQATEWAGDKVTLKGTVTVVDTLQNWTPGYGGYEHPITIIGNLINNGVIRNNPAGNYFVLNISGNITNNKNIINNRVLLSGSGNRTINDKLSSVLYYSTGEKVILYGQNYLPKLSIAPNSKCLLSAGSKIFVPNDNIDEALDNWSEISITRKFSTALTYSFFKSSVNVVTNSKIDSVRIQSFGHQVPPTFSGAVKCWWRLTTFSKTPPPSFSSLTLRYNDDLLGTNNESALQIYRSDDNGLTWKQVSTNLNTTRDLTNNSITINDALGFGDYLLSSTSDPTSVSPSIICSIIGSSNIRVGAPTRLKVQYVNNSDVSAEDCLITVNTGRRVHIKSVEVPLPAGGFLSLTKDSLFFANEDTTLVLYALKMAPREERTFDIIVVGDNPSLGKVKFIDPVSITVGVAVTTVVFKVGTWAVCKGIDYLGDKAAQGLKMTPPEQQNYDQYVRGGIPTEISQRQNGALTSAEKKIATEIIKRCVKLPPAAESALSVSVTVTKNMQAIAPSLRQRIFNWFYKETGLYGVEETQNGNTYQPIVSTVTQKKGTLVQSWDPNEKVGPTGFGDKKFITSAGKTTYQILFENKKEATAPAYKIVIIDTLHSVFDPTTVDFGKTSHEGSQYNWIITRTGNILKWEIEGIELPPNKVPPEGEGWVSFTVNTKNNLPSGTEIKNRAKITFDINPPINTNEYINKLDFAAPTTTMTPLGGLNKDKKFVIKWKSNDGTDGSGVESSTIFMSVDQSPYDLAGVSNSDSLLVSPLNGTHTYSFYALAKDNVGNVEPIRPAIVTTTVTTSIEKNDGSLPTEYSLGQNYPNPFNPSTVIRFSLPHKAKVLLEVFNLLGQRVEVLIDKELDASSYKVNFNAVHFASGIYFYRLITDDFIQAKKMVLIK